ncbi:MAG: hypothetical protein ACYDAG_15890 [Chloroflexota bacterium]
MPRSFPVENRGQTALGRTVAHPSIVSPAANVTVIQASSGSSYSAGQVGQITLTAVGDPPCRGPHPARRGALSAVQADLRGGAAGSATVPSCGGLTKQDRASLSASTWYGKS